MAAAFSTLQPVIPDQADPANPTIEAVAEGGAIPLDQIDQSKLEPMPQSIPLDQIDPAKLAPMQEGDGAIPLDQVDPSKLQTEDQYLSAATRPEIAHWLKQNRTRPDAKEKAVNAYKAVLERAPLLGFRDAGPNAPEKPTEFFKTLGQAGSAVLDGLAYTGEHLAPVIKDIDPKTGKYIFDTDASAQNFRELRQAVGLNALRFADFIRKGVNNVSNYVDVTLANDATYRATDPEALKRLDQRLKTRAERSLDEDVAALDLEEGIATNRLIDFSEPATNPQNVERLAQNPVLDPSQIAMLAGPLFRAGKGLSTVRAAETAEKAISDGTRVEEFTARAATLDQDATVAKQALEKAKTMTSADRADVAARALEYAETKQPGLLRRGVAATATGAAKVARKTENLIDSSPLVRGLVAGGAVSFAGGDPSMAMLSALIGAGTPKLGLIHRTVGRAGDFLYNAGEGMAGRATMSPMLNFAGKVLDATGKEAGAFAASQMHGVPFLLAAQSAEERDGLIAVNAIFHAAGVGAAKTAWMIDSSLNVPKNFFAARTLSPSKRIDAKPLGFDPHLDAAHAAAVAQADNTFNNFVSGIQDYFSARGKEAYLLKDADYATALENLVKQGALTPEQAQASRYQAGVTTDAFTGGDGRTRQVALSRVGGSMPGVSFGHEAVGHLLWSLASPEHRAKATETIEKVYGQQGLADAKAMYEANARRSGAPDDFQLTHDALLQEIFAENAGAVAHSLPIAKFGPELRGFAQVARDVYHIVGDVMETVGFRQPKAAPTPEVGSKVQFFDSGLKSIVEGTVAADLGGLFDVNYLNPETGDRMARRLGPDELHVFKDGKLYTPLGVEPSMKVAGLIENILQAQHLDADILGAEKPAPKAQTETSAKTESAAKPVTGEVVPVDPNATEIPGARPVEPKAVAPGFKKGDPIEEVRNASGVVLAENAKVVRELGTVDGVKYYEIEYTHPDTGERKLGHVPESWLQSKPRPGVTYPKGYEHPITNQTPEGAFTAPEGGVEGQVAPKQTENVVRPQAETPNVRTTAAEQNKFAQPATDEVHKANRAALETALQGPRSNRPVVETDYYSAKSPVQSPDATVRAAQRKAADAAEKLGEPNPLRAIYQKVFVPYSWTPWKLDAETSQRLYGDAPRPAGGVYGMSMDKLIQNVDLLRGALALNPEARAAFEKFGSVSYLASDDLRAALQKYLENQSHGYSGDGKPLQLPTDTRPGSITPVDPNYTPHVLQVEERQLFNLLMGLEQQQSRTAGMEFAERMARLNDNQPTTVGLDEKGRELVDTNPLRVALKNAGFDPRILNTVVENLPTKNFTTPLKARPDLHFPAGDTGITAAGFMPDTPRSVRRARGNDETRSIAREYIRSSGIANEPHDKYATIDPERMKKIADYYDSAKHDPQNPEVQKAYDALTRETLAQYDAMVGAGIQVEPYTGRGEPYKNSTEMMRDVRENKHLYFLKTEGAFGEGAIDTGNPLLADSGRKIGDTPLLVNDVFRAVHDFFGHTADGYEFGPRGEYNAYLAHSRMFSDEAKPALAAETLAQNAWVNFGPHLRRTDGSLPVPGDVDFKPLANRRFADQKTTIVPAEILNDVDSHGRGASYMPATRAVPIEKVENGKFWLSLDGKFYPVGRFPTHEEWARRTKGLEGPSADSFRGSASLYSDGWVRVSSVFSQGRVLASSEGGRKLAPAQEKALHDVGLFLGAESVSFDNGNSSRILYNQNDVLPGRFMPETKQDDTGFFSPLEHALRAIPVKATRGQIEAALRDGVKEKGQVIAKAPKQEELNDVRDVSGLSFADWMKQNPAATRDEMLDFVRENKVQIKPAPQVGEGGRYQVLEDGEPIEQRFESSEAADEYIRQQTDYAREEIKVRPDGIYDGRSGDMVLKVVRYGDELRVKRPDGESVFSAEGDLAGALVREFLQDERSYMIQREKRRYHSSEAQDVAQYEDYTLPGGKNYGEDVLTLPPTETPRAYVAKEVGKNSWTIFRRDGVEPESGNTYESKADAERAIAKYYDSPAPTGFTSSHFREVPNYLAHVRYADHEATVPGSDKKAKVLLAEEIQSDLHQKGRKEGYVTTSRKEELEQRRAVLREKFNDAYRHSLELERRLNIAIVQGDPETRKELWPELTASRLNLRAIESELESLPKAGSGVPDAPFKKSWHELGFKYLLKKAVERGADYLAWTTGKQQAERYDLSKQIQRIELQSYKPDQHYLAAYDHNGMRVVDKLVAPHEVEDYVGKEMAQKLESMPWKPYSHENPDGSTITRDSKTLSGLDLKVGGEGMAGFYDRMIPAFADKYLKRYGVKTEKLAIDAGEDVHAVKITPEMRADIEKNGQPMYMPAVEKSRQTETPEFKRWFNGSKVATSDGEPLRMYHQTKSREPFTVFNREKTRNDPDLGVDGFWFAAGGPDEVRGYGDMSQKPMEVYLSIKNPATRKDIRRVQRKLDEAGIGWDQKTVTEELQKEGFDGVVSVPYKEWSAADLARAQKSLDATGRFKLPSGGELRTDPERGVDLYDSYGEHITGYSDLKDFADQDRAMSGHFVAFDPRQIKSATDNRGTFDKANPDIRYMPQAGGPREERKAPTGWVLPGGKYIGASADAQGRFTNTGDFHGSHLAQNLDQYKKQFGLNEPDRLEALKKGFVRVRYDANTGRLGVEAVAPFKGRERAAVEQVIEDNIDRIDRVDVNLFNKKGEVIDQNSESVFRLDGLEKSQAAMDALRFMPEPKTDTPEFKRWFGKSVVVDESGNPLKMFHGVRGDQKFTQFKIPKLDAAYFTSDREYAKGFSDLGPILNKGTEPGQIHEVFIRLENPKEFKNSYESEAEHEAFTYRGFDAEKLKAEGYDGIIQRWPASKEQPDGEVIVGVFSPEQIKSATGNRGTFDPKTPDIRFMAEPATLDDFKPGNIHELPNKTDWAILSAENPGAKKLSADENAKRTASLWDDLDELGVQATPAKGKYGNEENSFMVAGITAEQAIELARKYGQESVLLPQGNTYLDGSYNPSTGKIDVHSKPPEDFYTHLPKTGSYFTLGVDFDQKIKPKPALANETVSPKLALANLDEPVGVSTVRIRQGQEKLDPGGKNVLDVGRALAERSRRLKRIPFNSRTAATKDAIARTLNDEIEYARSLHGNAIGWYEQKITEALNILAELHPEIASDKDLGSLYKALLAITSNGQAVTENFKRAEYQYAKYKETGKFDSTGDWGGARKHQINRGLKNLENLIERHGLSATAMLLNTKFTIRELKQLAKQHGVKGTIGSGESVDHVVYGSAIFGPKVGGGFYPNLQGDFSPVTMDLWLMRTWNRINGSYGVREPAKMEKALADLREAAANHPDSPEAKEIEGMSDARLGNWAEKRFSAWVRAQFKNGTPFDRPAKRFSEARGGQHESPRNGSERAFVREVFAEIDRQRKAANLPEINNADKQALLWYYEKDLYAHFGVRDKKSAPADYATAARQIVDSKRLPR